MAPEYLAAQQDPIMTNLKPPLRAIEYRLFDPSPSLIACWIAQDPRLAAETRRELETDPRACFLRDIQLQTSREPHDPGVEMPRHLPLRLENDRPLPSRIADLIRRHLVTRDHHAGIREAVAGQMRLISLPWRGDRGPLEWDLGTPLAVLLWRETATPGVWSGWLLANETDYATDADILLEREDEPYDPLVAMVQLWNPVQIIPGSSHPLIGQLGVSRLETLATAYADRQRAGAEAPIPARPGQLMERLASNGQLLLCGTPLGSGEDPRRGYQVLYLAAAALLNASARHAVASPACEAEPPGTARLTHGLAAMWERLSCGLRDLAHQLGQPLLPLEPITAMGTEPRTAGVIRGQEDQRRGYRIPGILTIEVLPLASPTVLKLHLSHLARQPLTLRLLLEGDVLEAHCLTTDQPELTLFIAPQPGLFLELQVNEGPGHRWSLHP